MYRWNVSFFLCTILLLASCNFQTVPEETLETTALQGMVVAPTNLNVPADSRTGVFLDLLGTFASTDTFTFSLVSPPTGISIDTPTLVQSISNRFRRFQGVLRVGPNVALGDRVITFQVISGTVTRTATLNLTVTAAPVNPTFKLIVSPNNLEVARSNNKTTSVFISRIKGFNQAITLSFDTSATTLTGVTATPVNLSGTTFTSNFIIAANATAAPFGLPFVTKVKGTAGNIVKQANLTITIKTPSGSLDPTFDGDGIVPISSPSGTRNFALALLSNNKIVTAQTAAVSTGPITLKRFNANGSVDTNFGTNGQITHTLPVTLTDVRIQALPDNKLIVVADAFTTNPDDRPGSEQVFILRLRASGQLDTTFSGDGIFNMDMPDESSVETFVVQSDGKILVGGSDTNVAGGVTVIRVNADSNSLDTGFGISGVVAINSNLNMVFLLDMAVQNDGKILLAGRRQSIGFFDAVVGRLLSNGIVDESFSGGFLPMNFGSLTDDFSHIALDTNQRILAFGERTLDDTKLARINSNATLDSSFSGDGHLTINSTFLASSDDVTEVDLIVQSDNKPLVLVKAGSNTLLVRLTTAGSLDTSFAGGKVTVSSSIDGVVQMALDSNGRIVVLGSTGLARYAP